MRICFLGDGSSIHIKRWLYYFQEKGHQVHLITFSDVKLENIEVHKIGEFDINQDGGNWRYILKAGEVKKIIKKINPDVVNAHYVTSYGFIAALTGFKNLVISAWGSDILVAPKRNIVYKLITKFALDRAKLITSDSDFMSEETRKLTKVRTITVPMGVEKGLCSLERKDENKEIKILSLRTVNKNSNIDIIVKAFSKILKNIKDKNIKLIITNDGPEMDNIKNLINELQIQDRVEIRGFISREELLNLLITSQVFVSILDSDSTSVTLLEAMACGVLPIVSDLPANKQWIEEKVNGIILKELKEEELYTAIKLCIEDNNLKDNAEGLNRDIILKKAIWEDNMAVVEKEYEQIYSI
ncbi:glycosyltransferase family 4 protein [Clostridium ganghwense]|uniref:Glycosyltransferase family 4 protein n=1 Tax=Clostridium ganghwense TaxID=312089 RepID=A0ABT4CR75_9CLOT|nr:glycosyltransferase family 4 protein [Clostridium ganghwense]MCY6370499.1 glycosyltransferase family 4 protein [Clostridium ganghwense]